MKKIIVIVFVVMMLGVLISSCKTHERCPAYNKVEKTSTGKPS